MTIKVKNIYALPATIAPTTFLVTFFAAAELTPEYSHLSDTVSSIAIQGQPYSLIARAGFIAYGILVIPLGFALFNIYKTHQRILIAKLFFLLFCLYGISDALAGIATDDPSWVVTSSGTVHDVAARTGFLAICSAIFLVSLKPGPFPKCTQTVSLALLIGTLISGALYYLDLNQNLTGLWQRCFFATTLVWVQLASIIVAFKASRYPCEQ